VSPQPLNNQPSTLILPCGVFYESDRPTKNALEKKWIDNTREKLGNPSDFQLLQKTSSDEVTTRDA
jgi:hypothetical protein